MNRVDQIKSKIESLVEEGDIGKGDIIKVFDLPEDLMILVHGCFAGNRDYEIEREVAIDASSPNQVTYNLYLKYVGKKHA